MQRRVIEVTGIVQGVGFRPFVYNLAIHLKLSGFVRNEATRVLIEVEGEPAALDQFLAELADQPPPLAYIEAISWKEQAPRGDNQFRIEASEAGQTGTVFISPDMATCPACLAELFDPIDRRFHYPFLNCTNCGPRLTITTAAPYDRSRTTMASFAMCTACRAEYDDPGNRRFHAQPTACPACGPRLTLRAAAGTPVPTPDPLNLFAQAMLAGKIGAIKGLGGYHLVCDARNAAAVAELRRRKHRDEKPFAVMVNDVTAAANLCEMGPMEQKLLQSPQAPIVLLRKRGANSIADIAPGNPHLGVMLPYTPLHHLLLRAVGSIPLVMTSGNRSDEPIAYQDDAVEKLAGIADLFLTHDRPIHIRCDDSVVRVVDGIELLVRRSRGYAPRPQPLPFDCPRPILAVGGQLKATFALAHGRQAFLSHHLGDLDHFEAFRAFKRDVLLFQQLLGLSPECLIHDLHPDYASTRYVSELAAQSGIPALGVQHHHAHMASCMAEHGLMGAVIGVTFDGTGYGLDGAVWGGEFLVGSYRECHRAGHLRYIAMPGGEKAIKEPWRMALAHSIDAGCTGSFARAGISPTEERVVRMMLERGLHTPVTSSMGRLFDAVAAFSGVRTHVNYEGQAAIELEWLANDVLPDGAYPFDILAEQKGHQPGASLVVDTRPLIRAIAADAEARTGPRVIARRFHSTVVEMIAAVCGRLRAASGLDSVVLSGGVFLNALLTHETCERLGRDGFRVYRHSLVPPNDGGLALGQVAIAAAKANDA
jgi:hydrogenase maturation protein HypF